MALYYEKQPYLSLQHVLGTPKVSCYPLNIRVDAIILTSYNTGTSVLVGGELRLNIGRKCCVCEAKRRSELQTIDPSAHRDHVTSNMTAHGCDGKGKCKEVYDSLFTTVDGNAVLWAYA